MLRASCFLYVLHGSSLALTFYSPFCWGDTLIYMDLCEPKSFELFKIWRYMDIYEDTLPMGAPSIPSFISLKPLFIGFCVFQLSIIADPPRWRKGANGGFFRWASGLRVPGGERCLAQLRIDSREKPVLELEKDRSSKLRGRAPEQRKETAAPRAAETRDGKLCAAAAGDPL